MQSLPELLKTIFPFVFGFLGAGIAIYIFTRGFRDRNKLMSVEKLHKAIYTENSGGFIKNKVRASAPMIRTAYYEDFMVISTLKFQVAINYNDMKSALAYKRGFAKVLEIEDSNPSTPKITLYTQYYKRVCDILEDKIGERFSFKKKQKNQS